MRIHPRNGNDAARSQPWNNARNRPVMRRRVKGDDGLSAFRVEGPADEVELASGPRELSAVNALRIALPQQIHFDGGVDGDEMVLSPDVFRGIDVRNRIAFTAWVVVDEPV